MSGEVFIITTILIYFAAPIAVILAISLLCDIIDAKKMKRVNRFKKKQNILK